MTAAVVPKLDNAWDELFVRALARSPAERFASAGEMLAGLDAVPNARADDAEAKLAALVSRFSEDQPVAADPPDLQETIRDLTSSL